MAREEAAIGLFNMRDIARHQTRLRKVGGWRHTDVVAEYDWLVVVQPKLSPILFDISSKQMLLRNSNLSNMARVLMLPFD
jgi:hypothetical protein